MKNLLFSGLSSLLLPMGAYAGPTAGASYQRTYLSSSISSSTADLAQAQSALPRDLVDLSGDQLDIQVAHAVRELVIVDEGVAEADKAVLRRALKPGVEMVQINAAAAGLPQLIAALDGHKNLAAIHIISHAEAGAILLGNSRITAENIQQEVQAFAALNGAVREGGDLLFYGCDLAANKAGEDLLDIISNKTGLDVAASNNLTGNSELQGDWDLEVKRGNVEAALAFSEKSLKDFSSVLVASSGTKDFTSGWTDNNSNLTSTDFIVTAKDSGDSAISNISFVIPGYANAAYIENGYNGTTTGTYFYVAADGINTGTFELTGLIAGEAPALGGNFTNVRIVGIKPDNTTITSDELDGTGGIGDTFTFGGTELASFSGVKLKAFKLVFDATTAANTKPYFEFRSFTITGALAPLPNVTDGRISISGASGTGGAYKIGDTVIATWNNTAGGDNNTGITGVTVDFSQFGGGAAVAATNNGTGTWTATYTITSGAIDTTSRNVSVTATNTNGSTTTADTTNATVDSIAPTVTNANINISGASGTSGAYKIGDTVTASWSNTPGGDNNSDTISNVTVNFTQFGGGAAVSASNSSGTWTATYTIVAGSIDLTNRNVTVTATDNAGNATSTSDTTNATVDNIAPTVSSIVVSGSPPSTSTAMAFTANFSESVANVSMDDFTLVGTDSATGSIAGVSASTGSAINVNITGISGNGSLKVNLNGSTNVADDAGNSVAAYSGGSTHTVAIPTAPDAPTIGMTTPGDGQVFVYFTAPASNGGSPITGYTAISNPDGITAGGNGFTSSPILVSGLTNGQAYTFTVIATNGVGDSVPSGATASVTPKRNQNITFGQPIDYSFGSTPNLIATSNVGLTIEFSSTTTSVCTVTSSGALTFLTIGTCTINADQPGDTTTNAGTTVTRSFTVNAVAPDAPTIGTATAGDTNATVAFTAPAFNGGANITGYTVTSNPGGETGTGTGSPITVPNLSNGVAYTFTVTATNAATFTGAASGVSNSVTPKGAQTITFANPGAQNFGTSPDLRILGGGASATSGDPVVFTSSTTGVCSVTSDGVLTFVTAGSCTINANQAGNSAFLAAPQVSQTFTVNSVAPDSPTTVVATAGDTQVSVAFVAPVNTGGSAITGYTVTPNPLDVAPVSGVSSPIVVSGLTNGQAYTFTVTADNLAGPGAASTPSNSVIPKATQTITFNNPGVQNFGTTPTLSANSDSGLQPTFTSATPGVCTITTVGGLTFVDTGTCTILADQPGNGSYLAAIQVSRSFPVNAVVPGVPVIGTATAGDGQASVTFTAPVFTGGTAITGYTVTSIPDGLTGTGTGSPIVVNGLTNGQLYTFSVTATNVVGTGSALGVSNAVTPNGAPIISGTPSTSVNQDAPYNFIPTASDTVGDTLVFNISNKPAWASFSTTTGALTGTPGNSDVGTTTGIVISVSDGSLSASLAAFNLTVTDTNDAPVISGTPATSVAQDATYSFTPTTSDIDVGSVLAFTITNKPTWATLNETTGALTGIPTNADVGTTTGIVITVSDGTLTTSLPAFDLEVVNVNDAPVISGTPATIVNQDAAYSFIPTASDVDVGDVLVFTITNKPIWATFDTTTGALTGTPTNADVGSTTGIAISVSDGTLSANLAAFNLEVTNVNEMPVISGTPVITVAQDVAYSFTPTASDDDVDDVLTFSITNKPTWAAFDTATGALTGTPTNADVGITTGIIISVSDGSLNTSLPAFDLEVTNVNEAPVISGTPTTSLDQDTAYSFTPTASDADVGDVLTFSITNKPTWASFDTATGALTGTPAGTDTGITTGIVISVSDGTTSAALPAFDIEVISTVDPLLPVVTPPADLTIDATGLFTPVSLRQLLSLNPNANQADLDAAIKLLAADGVTGNDCCTTTAEGFTAGSPVLMKPGRHEIKWKATNAVGVTGEATQVVNINPLVSLSKSQIAVRGSAVAFKVLLNGPAPVYPFSVPYVIDSSSTATGAEHDLVSGTATFTQAGQVEVSVPVNLAAVTGFSDSLLVVVLGDGINAGAANRHTIEMRQGNVPPIVNLTVSQGGINTSLVSPAGGPVTVTATVTDANTGDTHTFDWSATNGMADTDGNPANASRVFSPVGLTGSKQVLVTVTDSGGASVQASVYFRVVASLPVLDADADTDQDGINDDLEGTGDADDNGIPDYLDNMPSTNVLPQQGNTTNAYLIECDPGVRCGLGLFARSGSSGGVQVLDDELGTLDNLIVDPAFEPVGGVFDFAIRDLPTPGQSVRVVIPQRVAIPANAVYRKYQRGRWVSFITDANNAVHSAPGFTGYCPPPGNVDWTPGLTEGHLCVQLTIQDGGANDDDGLVNSSVVDPGAVSVELDIPAPPPEPPVPEPKPPVQVKSQGGGAMGGLWLVLLGGLLMLKRIKPTWIALVALVAASVNTQAAGSKGFYLRADIAGVTSSQEANDFSSALAADGYKFTMDGYDASRFGFQLALGLEWERHLYTELGYLDLGDVEVDLTLDGETDLSSFSQDFAANYPLSAEGLTLVQGLTLTPDAPIKVSAEVGVFVWRSEIGIDQHVFAVDDDEGEDLLVGIKLDVPMSEKFGFGLGLRRIYFDDQEADLFSLIGSYYF